MNVNAGTPETTVPTEACYRIRSGLLIQGIVCLPFFLATDVSSVYVAYWNVGGSFERPQMYALGFGVFWSSWVLLDLWLIAACLRERLFVTADAITQNGIVRTKTINTRDVTQVTWRRFPAGDSVVVRSHRSRIKIYFDNFTRDRQDQLITYLRNALPQDIQKNWTRFTEARLRRARGGSPKEALATAIVCALLFFSVAIAVGFAWVDGYSIEWFIAGIVLAFGGVWYVWRIFRFQNRSKRNKADPSDS